MNFAGVDACKKGWFAVALDRQGNWNIGIFKDVVDFWSAFQNASLVLIDMPIGLPYCEKRKCDIETRKLLGRRASSVFPVPCRKALQVKTYGQACRINQQAMGVKLSIQTWNIAAKIVEVDRFLRNNKMAQRRIRESHPELCFRALAGGHPMAYSKKKPQGFSERYSLNPGDSNHCSGRDSPSLLNPSLTLAIFKSVQTLSTRFLSSGRSVFMPVTAS